MAKSHVLLQKSALQCQTCRDIQSSCFSQYSFVDNPYQINPVSLLLAVLLIMFGNVKM